MSDRQPVGVVQGIILRNSLLPPEEADKLAWAIVKEMDLSLEQADIKGLNWLSLPPLFRWVSSWRS